MSDIDSDYTSDEGEDVEQVEDYVTKSLFGDETFASPSKFFEVASTEYGFNFTALCNKLGKSLELLVVFMLIRCLFAQAAV